MRTTIKNPRSGKRQFIDPYTPLKDQLWTCAENPWSVSVDRLSLPMKTFKFLDEQKHRIMSAWVSVGAILDSVHGDPDIMRGIYQSITDLSHELCHQEREAKALKIGLKSGKRAVRAAIDLWAERKAPLPPYGSKASSISGSKMSKFGMGGCGHEICGVCPSCAYIEHLEEENQALKNSLQALHEYERKRYPPKMGNDQYPPSLQALMVTAYKILFPPKPAPKRWLKAPR